MLSESTVGSLVYFAHEDHSGFMYEVHSDECWTVIVWFEDDMPIWYRATLGLDGRITLSPLD